MQNDKDNKPLEKDEIQEQVEAAAETPAAENMNEADEAGEEDAAETAEDKLAETLGKIKDLEDKNLRMMAEFDNYRRRTNKEKLEIMENAGEGIFRDMLPLMDDFERAVDAMYKSDDIEALREGIGLIQSKFKNFLDKHKVSEIETKDVDFSTDEHEAITTFAAGEDKKGKIIDCTQKGYKLGDKVIRFAKVVVGE